VGAAVATRSSLAPLAIGASLVVFNPAITLGAAVMGMFAWSTLWVYFLAPLIGGIAAGVAFVALNPDDT
jgi:aquaporin Z